MHRVQGGIGWHPTVQSVHCALVWFLLITKALKDSEGSRSAAQLGQNMVFLAGLKSKNPLIQIFSGSCREQTEVSQHLQTVFLNQNYETNKSEYIEWQYKVQF